MALSLFSDTHRMILTHPQEFFFGPSTDFPLLLYPLSYLLCSHIGSLILLVPIGNLNLLAGCLATFQGESELALPAVQICRSSQILHWPYLLHFPSQITLQHFSTVLFTIYKSRLSGETLKKKDLTLCVGWAQPGGLLEWEFVFYLWSGY